MFERCAGQNRASVNALIKEAERALVATQPFTVATGHCLWPPAVSLACKSSPKQQVLTNLRFESLELLFLLGLVGFNLLGSLGPSILELLNSICITTSG